jgi:hypothetical protein
MHDLKGWEPKDIRAFNSTKTFETLCYNVAFGIASDNYRYLLAKVAIAVEGIEEEIMASLFRLLLCNFFVSKGDFSK